MVRSARLFIPIGASVVALAIARPAPAPGPGMAGGPAGRISWRWLNPAPTPLRLNGVTRLASGELVAVGERSVVARSHDEGASWQLEPIAHAVNLKSVAARGTELIAVGTGGALLRFNGAAGWQRVPGGVTAQLNSVAVTSAGALAVGDHGTIVRIMDDQASPVPAPATAALRGVHALGGTAIAVGDDGTILRSTDAGASWLRSETPLRLQLRAVRFLDAQRVVAVGGDNRTWRARQVVLRSEDGGQTWRVQRQLRKDGRLYALTSAGDAVFAVGERGTLVFSQDAGASWKTSQVDTSVWLLGAAATDARRAVAVGGAFGQRVFRTLDGGENWKPIRPPPPGPNVQVLGIARAGRSIFITGAPNLAQSTDGGLSFRQVDSPGRLIIDAAFRDSLHGIAVGVAGRMIATRDGGRSWTPRDSLTRRNLRSIAFADANTVVAVAALGGNSPTVFRSTDGGLTWSAVENAGRGPLFAVAFAPGGVGYAAGPAGRILRTEDAGAHWSRVEHGHGRVWLRALHLRSAHEAIAVGMNGVILRTTDGRIWTRVPSGTRAHLLSIDFADDRLGVVVGMGGTVLTTVDGGASWQLEPNQHPFTLLDVDFDANGTALVTGVNGFLAQLQVRR